MAQSYNSIAAFRGELESFGRDLAGSEFRRITREQAERGAEIATTRARRDVGGDARFSGWRTPGPGERGLDNLVVRAIRNNAHILAPTRRSAGPWKVAELGRNRAVGATGGATGRGGGELFQGPGVDRRTGENITFLSRSGEIRVRGRTRAKKWSGYTDPMNTATEAVRAMETDSRMVEIADRGVQRQIRKHFG